LGRALLKSTSAAEESQDKPKLARQQGFSMDRLQQQLLAAIAARTAAVAAASSEFDAPPVPPRDDDHALRPANGPDDAWASPLPSPHRAVHAGSIQEAGQGQRQRSQSTSNGYAQSVPPPQTIAPSTCVSCAACSAAAVPQASPTPAPARTNYNFAAPASSSPGLRMAHKPAGVVRSVFSAADLVPPAQQKPLNVSHPITSSSAPVPSSLQRQSVGALVSRFAGAC
jgi:hypothetical protein